MDEIFKQLQDRFPLLTRFLLQEYSGTPIPQPLPAYLGIFLAVLERPSPTPVCFVLPRHGDVARLSAVLFVMHQLVRKQNELARAYAERSFNLGDLVRIHPGKQVFRYGGYDSEHPDRIWLVTINTESECRWLVPAAEIIGRLEKTTSTRPAGKTKPQILTPPPTPLDLLLGTSFSGNLSLVKNEMLFLDSVSGFESFTESCGVQDSQRLTNAQPFRVLLPFGRLAPPDAVQANRLRKWDEDGGTGEPIIAVTHSAESLAHYCVEAPSNSKLVVVNGLGHIRNLQAYDDISQTQRLVLFADHDNEDLLDSLGKRGCRVWTLDQREVLIRGNVTTSTGILGSITRCAKNYIDLTVDNESCDDDDLNNVFLALDQFRNAVMRTDDSALARVVRRAWGLFLNACSAWDIPNIDERKKALADIEAYRLDVRNNQAWLSPDNTVALQKIADGLANCYGQSTTLGAAKGATLLRVMGQEGQRNISMAILARTESKVNELRQWISRQSLRAHAEVFSPRTLPLNVAFDRVICMSWPGSDAMKQVVSKLAAPHVTVIGYPWERCWLHQCQPRFKQRLRTSTLSGDEKSALICGERQPCIRWPENMVQEDSGVTPTDRFSIWDFEHRLRVARIGLAARPTEATDTLPARYVRFSGDCYAFLTETYKLPIATELVSGTPRPNQALPERTLAEIRPGDFVVFPASGDRELIQELADRLIGPAAGGLRKVAHLWKDALRSSGLSPEEFLREARALNRPLHPATIRHWFADSSQIGPRKKDDLALIAIVTKNELLDREMDFVRSAIEKLWSAHLSAGMRLRDVLLQRLPQVIRQIEENGTKVDLDELGTAWIVRVESIEAEMEQRGRGEINRLLFEKHTVDLSDLLSELA